MYPEPNIILSDDDISAARKWLDRRLDPDAQQYYKLVLAGGLQYTVYIQALCYEIKQLEPPVVLSEVVRASVWILAGIYMARQNG